MTGIKSGWAPVNGLKMYYEIQGEGEIPLVLIHGGGSTIESNFGILRPLLETGFRLIAVELQAHGRTSDREGPESFVQDADDVAALLSFLAIQKADVVGFSNGGSTTLQLAIRHPALVRRIVPISAIFQREGMIAGFFDSMPKVTMDDMPRPLAEAYLNVAPDRDGLIRMFTKDKERMIHFEGWPEEWLKSIGAPTLLMVSDHDVVTVEHTLKMSRLIPGSSLVVLPGTHGSFIGEICTAVPGSPYPAITASIIRDFLSSID